MARVPEDIAQWGWVVEVVVTIADHRPESRFFAVGTEKADEAEKAVLRFPGIVPQDRRLARRRLSAIELSGVGLRMQAVRPYRCPSAARTGEETLSSRFSAAASAESVGTELMRRG